MTIPAATVRSLCTSAEVEIVRASRKPAIDRLSPSELKRLAARARKHFDKWNELARGQARKRGRQAGSSETPKNSKLKAQIFREAVEKLDAKLAEASGSSTKVTRTTSTSKKKRAAEHRATRAETRQGMAAAKDSLKSRTRKKQP